jgi:hypothetical protein
VGREAEVGGSAVGVLNLDNTASEASIERVNANKSIESAKLIQLPPVGQLPAWLS